MRNRGRATARVHLVGLSPMLDDTVRLALRDAAIELVNDPPDGHDDREATTLVVTSQEAVGDSGWCMDLLRRRPHVAILVIRQADAEGTLFELWPRRRSLGTVTAADIVTAATSVTPWRDRTLGWEA
jgi:hypothetical protein